MRLARLTSAALFLLLAAPPPATSGDAAQLEVLGFSADGAVFAFEEYGIQDGSGFPYSNRYYIDTAEDTFLPGTPVRVRLEDENATVERARGQARERGERILAQAVLDANRGFAAGLNPVTELSADPFRIAVNPRPAFPPIDPPLEFRLEEISLEPPGGCAGFGDIKGFRLLRVHQGTTEIVHEDKSIPRSRGCPLGYGLGGVQTFSVQHAPAAYAVIIAVRQHGFEGPDHRWIAVTRRW